MSRRAADQLAARSPVAGLLRRRLSFVEVLAQSVSALAPSAAMVTVPAIVLAEIESTTRLEGTQVLYRLGYADANELRPYARELVDSLRA